MDIFAVTRALLWLLPAVCLGRGFMSVVGKAMALLWQRWLTVGSLNLIDVLREVRSFASD